MKKKSILSMVLMLMAFGLTTFSCKKDSSSGTSSNDSNVPEGAIDAPFSVSEHRQVYFSKGNLQYKASTKTWRFAENQYDFIGEDNNNMSANFSGWIDLFGWGTSGYDHGAVCYQPWSTNDDEKNYYAYGSSTKNLYDNTGKADWGYNAISNGGNAENQWRTLTNNEWEYILLYRNTSSGVRYASAHIDNGIMHDTIMGVNGLLIFPDNWDESIMMNNINELSNYYNNRISMTDWNVLGSKGVVFLPAAGGRGHGAKTIDNQTIFNNDNVFGVNRYADYWTATSGNYSSWAYKLAYIVNITYYVNNDAAYKDYGRCVRLVQDIYE